MQGASSSYEGQLGVKCDASTLVGLVDGALGEVGNLRLQVEFPEGLFVLGEILAEHVPQGFGLLWAEEDSLMVLDAQLVGRLGTGLAEDEVKIPDADPHLHAVGIGVAISGSLY